MLHLVSKTKLVAQIISGECIGCSYVKIDPYGCKSCCN